MHGSGSKRERVHTGDAPTSNMSISAQRGGSLGAAPNEERSLRTMLNTGSLFRLYPFTIIVVLELHSKSATRLRVERGHNGKHESDSVNEGRMRRDSDVRVITVGARFELETFCALRTLRGLASGRGRREFGTAVRRAHAEGQEGHALKSASGTGTIWERQQQGGRRTEDHEVLQTLVLADDDCTSGGC